MSVSETRIAPSRSLIVSAVCVLVCFLGALIVLFFFEPGHYPFYPRCLFHQTTGLLCPGCGSLRAMHQLLHGHLAAAFRLNALLVLALPLMAWFFVQWIVRTRAGQRPLHNFNPACLWTFLAIGLSFGIIRNLPFAQTLWLAP